MMEQKNKKLLYIDYMFMRGHVNFNRIHIDALLKEGYNVKLVLHKEIARLLPYAQQQYVMVIPRILGANVHNPVLSRIIMLLTIIYIKLHVRFSSYEHVVISCMDEITLGIYPFCRKMFIICHGNARGLANRVKRFFIKRLAKHNAFIVFNESMKEPFVKYGIRKVFVVSHGCVPPFQFHPNVPAKFATSSFKRLIFHPSPNIDSSFADKLLYSEKLQALLQKEECLLILRNNNHINITNANIIYVSEYLPVELYQNLFLTADIILNIYPARFKYMVSGVSFECVANQKKMLFANNSSLNYCNDFYNYQPMFKDIDDLCHKISYLLHTPTARCTVLPAQLTPTYKAILYSPLRE